MPDGQPLTVSEAQKIFRKKKAYVSLGQIPLPPQLTEPEEVVIPSSKNSSCRPVLGASRRLHSERAEFDEPHCGGLPRCRIGGRHNGTRRVPV